MSTTAAITGPSTPLPQPSALVPSGQPQSGGLTFGDILDTVNPLQHIPVLSNLYRAVTGSQISPGAQIAGDTLYGAALPGGALLGFASSVADVAVKQATGKDISQNLLSAVTPSSGSSTQTASSQTATPLVPSAQAVSSPAKAPDANAAAAMTIMHLSRDTLKGNAQYERAQAFDALNSKLVKMAV